jgi:hypothetical protein
MGSPAWSVPLPQGAEPPYDVYVNAQQQQQGADYVIEGRWVRFTRPLRPQPPLSLGRRIMLAIGIGVYGDLRGDVVDIGYRAGETTQVATGLPIIPPSGGTSDH